jgi:hypothetical protein
MGKAAVCGNDVVRFFNGTDQPVKGSGTENDASAHGPPPCGFFFYSNTALIKSKDDIC